MTTAEPRERVASTALLAVCLGYFLVILDSTVVNVALPALQGDLRADVTGLQWVVDGYLLTFAAGLLSGGALGDRFGARLVFQWGLGLFVLSSVACGLAPDIGVLVGARLVQGVAAALMVPTSLSLLRAAYPLPATRARAVGVWGGIAGLAAAGGPIVGGVLVEAASWRWVFFVNIPFGVLAFVLTAFRVPAPAPRPRRMDIPGQLIAALCLAALTFALITQVYVLLAVFVVGGVGFVLLERRIRAPMIPLGLFRSATFSSGTVVGLLINLGFYGEMFVLNLYFQHTLHYSPMVAGIALLPQMGVVALGSALSGRLTSRAGSPRPTMLLGLLVGAAGLIGLAFVGGGYWLLLAPLIAAGFGMSFTMPAATTAVVESAPADHGGLAAGVVNTARQTGSVVGIAALGSLTTHFAFAAAGVVFLVAAAITLFGVHRHGQTESGK